MLIQLIKSKVLEEYPEATSLDFSNYYMVQDYYSNGTLTIKVYNSAGIPKIYTLKKDCYIREDEIGKQISIYDDGRFIGKVIHEEYVFIYGKQYPYLHSVKDGLHLLVVETEDRRYNILRMPDTDYAIIVSDKIAKAINYVIDEMAKINKSMKDILNDKYGLSSLNNKMEEVDEK